MTVFLEHLLPGVFFIIFGVWLKLQTWRNYFRTVFKERRQFRSRISYASKCRRCHVDFMAVMLCFSGVVGMVTQLTHIHHQPWFHNGTIDVTTAHHVTMYFFFGLAGIFKLFHPLLKRVLPQLEKIEYIVLTKAFVVQALLFKFHLMDRDILDTMLHTCSLYAVYACILTTLAELIFRNQLLVSLGRSYFIILQGTWLSQIAFILDSPFPGHVAWNPDDVDDLLLTTCLFTWHIGGVFLFSLLCGVGWAFVYKRRGELRDVELSMEPIGSDGYKVLISHEEDAEPNGHMTLD